MGWDCHHILGRKKRQEIRPNQMIRKPLLTSGRNSRRCANSKSALHRALQPNPSLWARLLHPRCACDPQICRARDTTRRKRKHTEAGTQMVQSQLSGAFDGGTEGRAGWGGGAVGSGSVSEGLGGRVGGWDGGRHKVEQRGGGGC